MTLWICGNHSAIFVILFEICKQKDIKLIVNKENKYRSHIYTGTLTL